MLWWSLSGLHQNLDLAGTPSAWYHKHWQQWCAFVAKGFGLSGPHLRRAAETKRAVPELRGRVETGELPEAPERMLPHYSLSTFGLLLLACKWAGNRQNKVTGVAAGAWYATVEGIVDTWFRPLLPFSLPIFLDPTMARRPGEFAEGRGKVVMLFDAAGQVTCEAVLSCQRCPGVGSGPASCARQRSFGLEGGPGASVAVPVQA